MKYIHVFQFEIFLTDGIELPCKSQCQWSKFGDGPNWYTIPYSQLMVSLENKLELRGSYDELKEPTALRHQDCCWCPGTKYAPSHQQPPYSNGFWWNMKFAVTSDLLFFKCVYIINNVLHDTIHHTMKYTILTYIYIDIEPCAWMHAKTDIK